MLEMKADAEIESARGQLELQRQEMDKRKCKARYGIKNLYFCVYRHLKQFTNFAVQLISLN